MAPTVTHNGELLTCGVHYVLQGDFVMTEAGDYTLTILGIISVQLMFPSRQQPLPPQSSRAMQIRMALSKSMTHLRY